MLNKSTMEHSNLVDLGKASAEAQLIFAGVRKETREKDRIQRVDGMERFRTLAITLGVVIGILLAALIVFVVLYVVSKGEGTEGLGVLHKLQEKTETEAREQSKNWKTQNAALLQREGQCAELEKKHQTMAQDQRHTKEGREELQRKRMIWRRRRRDRSRVLLSSPRN